MKEREGNIVVYLKDIGWQAVERIHLAQDRRPVTWSFKKVDKPSGCLQYWDFFK
jgi:hypothetical protein